VEPENYDAIHFVSSLLAEKLGAPVSIIPGRGFEVPKRIASGTRKPTGLKVAFESPLADHSVRRRMLCSIGDAPW
jgi:hypothetical protein